MAASLWLSARRRHVFGNRAPCRHSRRAGTARTTPARPATHVCRQSTARLVPRWWGCPGAPAVAVDLHGPYLPGLHAGVPRHDGGIAPGGGTALSGPAADV